MVEGSLEDWLGMGPVHQPAGDRHGAKKIVMVLLNQYSVTVFPAGKLTDQVP